MTEDPPSRLRRGLGIPGAVVVGLSAMLGTGVFAVWTPAWQWAGPLLLLSLLAAASVAMLNAVSTARLASRHPESGGVYAYGRLRLNRPAGVAAGVAFLVGKSASAAAAALTIGAYAWPGQERAVAWAAIVIALLVDLRGIVRSVRVNAVLVGALIVIVMVVVFWGATHLPAPTPVDLPMTTPVTVLAAAGLLFVAFAGYARIAVLGEEVKDPSRTIPIAMAVSFAVVLVLYAVVGGVVTAAAARGMPLGPAPLESLVSGSSGLSVLVVLGAVLGAGAVLLSLLAGMGRTLFAMAARGDAPGALAAVSSRRVPHRAAIAVAVVVALLVVPGRLSWALALSGGSVLLYYAVAHAASFTVPGPWAIRRLVPVAGLVLCVAIVAALLVTALGIG